MTKRATCNRCRRNIVTGKHHKCPHGVWCHVPPGARGGCSRCEEERNGEPTCRHESWEVAAQGETESRTCVDCREYLGTFPIAPETRADAAQRKANAARTVLADRLNLKTQRLCATAAGVARDLEQASRRMAKAAAEGDLLGISIACKSWRTMCELEPVCHDLHELAELARIASDNALDAAAGAADGGNVDAPQGNNRDRRRIRA